MDSFDCAKSSGITEASRQTSGLAATSIEPLSTTLRGTILDFIRRRIHGATDEEIQDGLLMNPSTQRPRRIELLRAGWIEASPNRRTTKSGRLAVVWIATLSKDASNA